MIDDILVQIKAYDWGQSRAPLLAMDREIRNRRGHPEHLAVLEDKLLEVLKSDAKPAAKRYVCQRLSLIGSERSIPTLVAMLDEASTADIARYALERTPGEPASAALRDALSKTSGKAKVGIINSLGARRDSDQTSQDQLAKLLHDSDESIACAAAWALGEIGGAEAVLAAQIDSAKDQRRLVILDACLASAERLKADGKKADADRIYKQLQADGMPAAVQRAAAKNLKLAAK